MREVYIFVIASIISGVMVSTAGASDIPERTVELKYVTWVKEIPEGAETLRLWIPLPQNNLHQEVSDFDITSPFPYKINVTEGYGNKMLYVEADKPTGAFQVTVSYIFKRYANVDGFRSDEKMGENLTLAPQKLVPISEDIAEIALEAIGDADSGMARGRALFDHTFDYMTYDKSGTCWGTGDFNYARKVAKGSCKDFHAYFIGLARNAGIPAYSECGVLAPEERGEGKTGCCHCWAYFWDGEYWVPVDISEADKHPEFKDSYFANHNENNIAFSRGRDLILDPPQQGEPLSYFIDPYAEIDGELHNGVSKEVYYKDM